MGEGKNIIDLRQGRSDQASVSHNADSNEAGTETGIESGEPLPVRAGTLQADPDPMPMPEPAPWLSDDVDDAVPPAGWLSRANIIAALVLLAWTGLFVWAMLPQWQMGIAPEQMVQALSQWAMPVAVILTLYLISQRNSIAEARRFAGVAGSLRAESTMLETRLGQINSELSLAREFLANQSLELESLGRVSSDRLRGFAEELRIMIAASDGDMRAIGAVSEAASGNMEKLRNHLPVIANSAKDVTNQIGNAGRTAQGHVETLAAAFARLDTIGQQAASQIASMVHDCDAATGSLAASVQTNADVLCSSVTEASQQMDQAIETVASRLANARANLDQAATTQAEALDISMAQLRESLDNMSSDMAERANTSRTEMRAAVDDLGLTLGALAASTGESEVIVRRMIADADAQITAAEQRLLALDTASAEALGRIAFALSALDGNVAALSAKLATGSTQAAGFGTQSEQLRMVLSDIERQLEQAIPAALGQIGQTTEASEQRITALGGGLTDMDSQMSGLVATLGDFEARIAQQQAEIGLLADTSETGWSARAKDIGALITKMRAARGEIDQINASSAAQLVETMRDVQREAHAAADEARRAMDSAIIDATAQLGEDSGAALEKVLRGKAQELVGKLESAINRAVGATSDASLHLKDQLVRVDDLASHLEHRVAAAREQAEERTDNDFARRMALLTESLNSAAIDVDKILSAEVSDTAWSAYLRGDRGVFTRRAVRLIDSGQAKDIAAAYENDAEFFELVNRYIHDFESMLRTILSTRDGGVIGVTLLSSETGKLYVALAQAIERLRD